MCTRHRGKVYEQGALLCRIASQRVGGRPVEPQIAPSCKIQWQDKDTILVLVAVSYCCIVGLVKIRGYRYINVDFCKSTFGSLDIPIIRMIKYKGVLQCVRLIPRYISILVYT